MPPLLMFAVVGAGCYAGFKLFSKLITQAQTPGRSEQDRMAREARGATGGARDLGELEWDEKSGVYRPKPRA